MQYKLGDSVRITPLRKTAANRLRTSMDTAVQANHRVRADMTRVHAVHAACKQKGTSITIGDIVHHCTVGAIQAMPLINSRWTDGGIQIAAEVNLGFAVSTQWGLVVPVIHSAQGMSLEQLANEKKQLAAKAKSRKLQPAEMEGGTFTVSNLGQAGIESFTAVINPPEAGILAVGSIVETVVPSTEGFAVKPLCTLSLTYDHRILDGAPAAEFLLLVKANIEEYTL